MEQFLRSLSTVLPLIIVIVAVTSAWAVLKVTVAGIQASITKSQAETDRRFEAIEKLIATMGDRVGKLETDIAGNLATIKTMLATRPCMRGHGECDK